MKLNTFKQTSRFILLALLIFQLSSCVSTKKYEELQSKERKMQSQLANANDEIESLKTDKEQHLLQAEEAAKNISALKNELSELQKAMEKGKALLANLEKEYESTKEHYKKQLSGKNSDLESAKEEVLKTKRELELRELEIQEKEKKFAQLQSALSAKDEEMKLIRKKLSDALVGFSNKGLSVEIRNGNVYVSMEEKLLFASGSWSISKDGALALKEVAKVLESNPDIRVTIEGHTDNVPLKGRNDVKDNWDLSVMRATSIVKVLSSEGKIDPSHITASGRGEYMPLLPNSSDQNRARNRRSEIILTPNLDQVMTLINE